jgi:hypothetical protein
VTGRAGWVDFAVLAVLAVAVYALGLARTPRLTYSGA